MTFIPTEPEQLILGMALLALHAAQWVEPLTPPWRPFPILAQQMLAIVVQTGGIARSEVVDKLTRNAAFARIRRDEIELLLEHLINEDILAVVDGTVTFGIVGERRFGRRNFGALSSVFSSGDIVHVQYGSQEIGTLDRWFVDEMEARNRSTFLLNGKPWAIRKEGGSADRLLEVVPAPAAAAPMFMGAGIVLSFEVMQSVRRMSNSASSLSELLPQHTVIDDPANRALNELRTAAESLDRDGSLLLQEGSRTRWLTYAGVRANRLLADLILEPRGVTTSCTNTTIVFSGSTLSISDLQVCLTALNERTAIERALAASPVVPKTRSKFSELLPGVLLKDYSQERAYDVSGALAMALAPVRSIGQQSSRSG